MVIGLVGGLLAFGASFAVADTYVSGTRLLIRGREASFLTDSAQNVSNQPGIIDASFAKTLGETHAGLVSSEQMAVAVVDKLGLDKKPTKKDGVLTRVVRQGILAYAKTKAVLAHGHYNALSKREQAISDVHGGLLAKNLKDSYILEIAAAADSAEGARDIANAAADALISQVALRDRSDAARYADALDAQLAVVREDQASAAWAVANFKVSRGIANIDSEIALDATSIGNLRIQARQNEVDRLGATAQLVSIKKSLTGLASDQKGEQVISAGRSKTVIASNQPSAIYQQLVQQRDTTTARIAEFEARGKALAEQLKSVRQLQLNSDQAALLPLQQQLEVLQQRFADLSLRRSVARATADNPGAELTRIDSASLPNYPVAPKHYLYLALGLLLGAFAGWGITELAGGRRSDGGRPGYPVNDRRDDPDRGGPDPASDGIDDVAVVDPVKRGGGPRTAAPVAQNRGHSPKAGGHGTSA